jgi:hypothetical protein
VITKDLALIWLMSSVIAKTNLFAGI